MADRRRETGIARRLGFRPLPADVAVFAVEPTAVQVVWRSLPPGPHVVGAGQAVVTVDADGGPGAVDVDGLPPATALDVTVDGTVVDRVLTLPHPPGAELFRFATVSDTHIGADRVGRFPVLRADPADEPPPERGLRAAIAEATAWGAQLLVVKGDITQHGVPAEWARAAEILGASGVPVEALPGNHDVQHGSSSGSPVLAQSGIGLTVGGASARDVPGLRLVLLDTTSPGHHGGTLARSQHALDLVPEEGPVMVLLHHHLQRWGPPVHWPPGVPGPEGRALLHELDRRKRGAFVTSGHTHRHRARRHGTVTVTEVGATWDHPGTWAGYTVHEGGMAQVVRRVAAPDALRWTEDTARVAAGLWARWAPGSLDDRCLTVSWPEPHGS